MVVQFRRHRLNRQRLLIAGDRLVIALFVAEEVSEIKLKIDSFGAISSCSTKDFRRLVDLPGLKQSREQVTIGKFEIRLDLECTGEALNRTDAGRSDSSKSCPKCSGHRQFRDQSITHVVGIARLRRTASADSVQTPTRRTRLHSRNLSISRAGSSARRLPIDPPLDVRRLVSCMCYFLRQQVMTL